MTTHDRSPFVFDTLELGRRAGSMRELTRTVEAPVAIGTDILSVQVGEQVAIELRLEAVMEGVLATGLVRSLARGECGRCLDPMTLPVEVEFQQLYQYPDKVDAQEDASDDMDDLCQLDGDLLDISQPITDAVGLELPFQPLCDEQCPGMSTQYGVQDDQDPDHHHDNTDPRWSALQQLASFNGTREEK